MTQEDKPKNIFSRMKMKHPDTSDESLELLQGVYVYVSMDLTNSTLFKSRHKHMWPKFISAFYESVMDNFGVLRFRDGALDDSDKIDSKDSNSNVMNHIGEFQLWKTVGDEVLLYCKVPTWDAIYNTIVLIDNRKTCIIDQTINKAISNTLIAENYDEQKANDVKKEHEQIYRQYFDIKTTVWIASCAGDISHISSGGYPNLAYKSTNYSNEEINNDLEHLDFMGPDIDEGFRLCEFAEKKQMIISPKLMYLLIKLEDGNKDKLNILDLNFRIVNYVTMKGVWENRLYPIIMFCQQEPTGSKLECWKKMFEYDAFENSLLYANIEKHGDKFLNDTRYSVMSLENIYKNAVREDEVRALVESFKKQEEAMKQSSETKLVGKKSKFEFHVACLCYNNGKFWLTKHAEHGWSFGCVQVSQNTGYFEYVKKGYAKKYNLEIELSKENDILSFYSANRKLKTQDSILGIVLLVTKANDIVSMKDDDGKMPSSNKKGAWYTYEEAIKLEDKKMESFDDILEKAYHFLKEERLIPSDE